MKHRHIPLLRRSALSLALAASFPALAATAPDQPVTEETRVNSYITGGQVPAGVAMSADGDFVVTWLSDFNQDGSGGGAYARRFNADGTPASAEIPVNTTTTSEQWPAGVAMDANGDFVVTWSSLNQDGSAWGVYARRFNADGTPATAEIPANVFTTGTQLSAGVAMDADGDFVVTWRSYGGQDGSGAGVYARRFNADGTPASAEISVTTFTGGVQWPVGVAMSADGDFVVIWDGQDGSGEGVYARGFNADGSPATAEIQVNTFTTNTQRPFAVAMDADGDFVVTWLSSLQDGSDTGVYARRFSADGTPVSAEILVNTRTVGTQWPAGVAMDADGDFVVTWYSSHQDGSGDGAYARRFNASGTPASAEIQINTFTTNTQRPGGVAMDADGDFVVTWTSRYQDGSGYGAYVRKFSGAETVDISATLTDAADPAQINGSLTWSLTATNNHASVSPTGVAAIDAAIGSATGLSARLTLPAGTVYDSTSADPEWTCAHNTGTVSCRYSGALAAGATQTVDISANAPGSVGKLIGQSSVSAHQIDLLAANNSDDEKTLLCDTSGVDTISFLSSSSAKAENAGSALISVIRSGNTCGSATVNYSSANGTATAGSDYTSISGTLNWSAGEQGKKTFQIPLTDDSQAEANETLTATLSNGPIAAPNTHVLTIKDNDTAPTVSLTSGDQSISEAGGVATITATLSAVRGTDLTVPLVLTGTAKNGTDYTRSGNLVILANQPSGSITLTGVDDGMDEYDETINVTIGNVTGATPAGATSNQVILTDDDALPIVSFVKEEDAFPESKPKAGRLRLSAVSGKDVMVRMGIQSAAALGEDFQWISRILIPAGKLEVFAFTVLDDAIAEPDEKVTVVITGADNVFTGETNATVGSITRHTHTIRNDD